MTPPPVNRDDVSQLTSMGFSEKDCVEALQITSGNLEMAVNHLLSGGVHAMAASSTVSGASSSPSFNNMAPPAEPPGNTSAAAAAFVDPGKSTGINQDDVMLAVAQSGGIIQANMSQYDIPDGRSGCTCIALTAASSFFADQTVTSWMLDQAITEGVEKYRALKEGGNGGGVEHLSAEEVLGLDPTGRLFPVRILQGATGGGGFGGGIRQGVLSHEMGHPLGMQALLQIIRQEQPLDEWICVLVTKTPETVLLCFPPPRKSHSPSLPEADAFWLIDSHPRPHLGLSTGYAKLHPTLDTLLMSLRAILPPTQIEGVPEMMAMMYNSFDLYPLQQRGR